ncbi:MAG: phosphopantetheine-binding protein [Halofilum sp. (in: g-proteobacteria)]|nr:phosphopantetheine-binding protein [Halofilum sp. (in: g-proteobacteria)]
MVELEQVRAVVGDVLQLGSRAERLGRDSELLGSIPEFDSMAVVSVITALEDEFDIEVDDDDISAETFETLGTLVDFVNAKVAA